MIQAGCFWNSGDPGSQNRTNSEPKGGEARESVASATLIAGASETGRGAWAGSHSQRAAALAAMGGAISCSRAINRAVGEDGAAELALP